MMWSVCVVRVVFEGRYLYDYSGVWFQHVFCDYCGAELRGSDAMRMQRDEEDFLHFSALWALPEGRVGDGSASFFTRPAKKPERKAYPFYLEEERDVVELAV